MLLLILLDFIITLCTLLIVYIICKLGLKILIVLCCVVLCCIVLYCIVLPSAWTKFAIIIVADEIPHPMQSTGEHFEET